ncbi:MAG: alanine racemase [Verrucomicrobia bacterium]|nr:alanine racemase [Verrucomicrobiota bacterium]
MRTWAEIDLAALRRNLGVVRRAIGPGREIMAVVKADAYGHGLANVAGALSGLVSSFGVANPGEARVVAGQAPGDIFLLGPVLPQERDSLASPRLVVAISTLAEAEALNALGFPVRAHLCVDTGMGRMGCLPEEARALGLAVSAMPNLRLEGVCTHFPSADEDAGFTRHQIAGLRGVLEGLPPAAGAVHLSNSAGILEYMEDQPFASLVRPGLMLYGLCPTGAHQGELEPVLSLRSRLTLVRLLPAGHGVSYGGTHVTNRPTLVATVGIGYADGYPRQVSNRGAQVLLQGRRCPVLGRVTMDQIMVDVSDLPVRPEPGDVVTLIGREGGERILASEVADWAGTISWEILTGLTSRVARVCREG